MSDVWAALPASFPSPPRGVWEIGPLPLRAYAFFIIVGIVFAVWSTERRFVARGGASGFVTDVAVWAVPFGLVGGRLYHVATDWRTYFGPGGRPVEALYIWQGGLGIWGAVALGGVGAWIACRRRGVPLTGFADAAAPGIVVAQAVGRLGNYFNQELYGDPTTMPWGLEIYQRVNPSTGVVDNLTGVAVGPPIEVVQPTFLYELIWNLLVAALVVWADRRFTLSRGRAFALYVAGYTAGRFVIELLRSDPATRVFGDIRINVVVSAVVFLGAVVYFLVVRGPREDLSGSFLTEDAPGGGASRPDPADSAGSEQPAVGNAAPMSHRSADDPAERSEAASTTIREQHGASDASAVDAAPDDPGPDEDAPAEPPSASRSTTR